MRWRSDNTHHSDTLPTLRQGGTDKKITLLPGADVFIAVWNLHRSPDLWENPEKFDISRWTKPFTNPKLVRPTPPFGHRADACVNRLSPTLSHIEITRD